MNSLNVAVAGCTGKGVLHLNRWSQMSGIRIAAVCDADGIIAARTAANINGAAAFTVIEAMLASEMFDIVDVCVPARERFEATRLALSSGANVLSETPIASTVKQAAQLATLASQRERILMPAFVHRFHPPILFIREMLDNDDMGRQTMFRCRLTGSASFLSEDTSLSQSSSSSGVLNDTGLHGVDLFRYLVGEAISSCRKTSVLDPSELYEDFAALVLQSDSGAIGVIEASRNLPGSRNLVEIYGTAGSCLLDYDTGSLHYCTANHASWETREVNGLDGLERLMAHFADVARGLQLPILTAADGVRAQEICTSPFG